MSNTFFNDNEDTNENISENENLNINNIEVCNSDSLVNNLDSPVYDEILCDEVTSAYPMTQINSESNTTVASESLVGQYFEELFNDGEITGSEIASYKKRFLLLCQLLERSRENEFNLLQLSKKWTLQVEKDKAMLALSHDYPDDSNTEVSKMRQDLLKSHNDYLAFEDRLETLNYKIVSLDEEKKMLESELRRLPGLKDKEAKKKAEETINELKKEIYDLKNKNKEYIELSKKLEESVHNANDEYNLVCHNINILKAKLVENNSLLIQKGKGIEKLRKENSEQSEIKKKYDDQLTDIYKLHDDLEKDLMGKEESIGLSKMEFNKLHSSYIVVQSELDEVKKSIEKMKAKETELQLEKIKADFDTKHILNEKQRLRDDITVKTKIKDRVLKILKEAKLQLKSNSESLESIKLVYLKAQSDLAVYPKSDILIKESLEKKKQEIEHRKQLFDVQNIFSEVEKAKLTQSAQEEERLLYDLSDLRIEVVELTRLAQIKADEREQKAKEYILKEKRFHNIIDEMKEKILIQQDYEKKHSEIQLKLEDFAKLYNVIQMERNKCANLINSVTHKSSEMKEKIKILNNEIEILRTNLMQKEKYVQKQRTKLGEILSIRDSLRNEISEKNVIITNQKEKRDQIQLDIQRLNQLGNQAEEAMVHLRKQNDLALQNRNDRAVQLIERNEEVCILQEKYNIKEEIIKNGETEIQIRNEEIKFLKQNIKELKRQVDLFRKMIGNKVNLEREAVNIKIQVEITKDQLMALELKSENPEEKNRIRILHGDDLSQHILQHKLDGLQSTLMIKEENLIEKELLLEAVTRLVKEIENKVLNTKMDTLQLSRCVNDYKFQISHIVRRLKAETAELTMSISKSLQLQQDIQEQNFALKQLYDKIENSEDIEFNNLICVKSKPLNDIEIHQYELTNGKLTTAEPRPNAYLPENGSDLQIPRPYGAQAPFRPLELGTNIRHIRKQKLKPIEI